MTIIRKHAATELTQAEIINLAARSYYHDNNHDELAKKVLKLYFAYAVNNIKLGHKVHIGNKIALSKKSVRANKDFLNQAFYYWVAV